MRLHAKDVLGIVESAYRVDQGDEGWLEGVMRASAKAFGGPAAAYFVDASNEGAFDTWGYRHEAGAAPLAAFETWQRDVPLAVKEHVHLHASWNYGTLIPSPDRANDADALAATVEIHGYVEILGLNAIDATRRGCAVAMSCPRRVKSYVSRSTRALVDQLVAHIATGARLRRRLADLDGAPGVEAILAPSGRVEHAEGEAKDAQAREVLRDAAVRIDRARAKGARLDEGEVTRLWQAIVAQRWTLVDQFERDGRRFYVARNNAPETREPRLTAKEAAVASAAALGHSNKMIAYELGMSLSTVATHLRRAAQKLGVASRVGLVTALRGEAAADPPEE